MSAILDKTILTARPLEKVWPTIEPTVRQMCLDLGYPLSLVDEIHTLCAERKAWLYTVAGNDAFVVVRPEVNESTGGVAMAVWAGYNNGQPPLTFEQYNGCLDELARGMGASVIKFHSRRKGFERAGWAVDDIIYSRPTAEA